MLSLRDYEDDEEILEVGFFNCGCGEVLETNGEEDIECDRCGYIHKFEY